MKNVVFSKLPQIESAIKSQQPIRLDEFFREIACDVVATTVFASDTTLNAQLREVLSRIQVEHQRPFWGLPLYRYLTFIPSVRQGHQDLKTLETIARTILNERRAQKTSDESHPTNKTKYLIDLLNSAQDDESKTYLTDEEIIHNVFLFFQAGTNTTGGVLTWVCHHLVCYPEIYEKVQKEIDEVIPSDLSKLSLQDVSRLTYLNMVINETLRYTPPLWRTPPKHLVTDTQIGEWECEKDVAFYLHIYQIHHSPDLWPNPEKFDPERWASEKPSLGLTSNDDDVELSPEQREKKIIETYKFVPFGAGRRVCIGKYFSMLEMRIVLSILLRTYKLKIPEKDISSFPKGLRIGLHLLDPSEDINLMFERRTTQ
eukprot:TRINITY_DN863_c0_g1_i3.p1 TRINITY_DN863_c0_g1~~TRINITY_DN863_c0_g1_i3.p1  ORF type:complete len:371 (+),score=82.63 TRINITY_DN863_c0_g1_i3:382-1494(+)